MSESKSTWIDLPEPRVLTGYVIGAEVYTAEQVRAALLAERERCASIADDEARIREEAGRKHPEDSESRGRCFAGARAAQNVAKGIRWGERL